ncbi:hypothetical protein [Candidatus Spongiihabitans sp.]|uniref:hypothetical protein n=1 Tax=Candidatus Spongiihabitans sp. TaxID=3101308 RepID=UPI003C7DB809
MNADTKNTAKLFTSITAALAELDLRGEDQQVTRAMAIVTEAFLLQSNGRRVMPDALLAKANEVVDECMDL